MLYPRKHTQSTELLTPRYRQTASNFVSAWIDNVPHVRHDSREDVREITKTRSFGLGSGKHGPQTGYPDMYFENDVFNNSRHRSTRESWEPDTRKSLSTPTTSDVAEIREKAEFPTRFRPAATLSANLSVISRADTSENFQRAKRGAVGPSHKACKPPSDPSKSTQEHKPAAQNDPSDQDLICREREFLLKDRALFMRERESFLDEKQRFYSEKDVQLQLRGKSTIKKTVDTLAGTPKSSDTVLTGCALSHTHPSPQSPSGSSAVYEATASRT